MTTGGGRHIAGRSRAHAAIAHRVPGYVVGLRWAVLSARLAHRQLHDGGLNSVALTRAPTHRPGTTRGVRHGLALARPSCLERSLVRRRWHESLGRDIPIVIGVRHVAGEPFGAHAWLQGDPPDAGNFSEIAVWPVVSSG